MSQKNNNKNKIIIPAIESQIASGSGLYYVIAKLFC